MRGGMLASSLPSGTAETPAGVTGCEAEAGSTGTPAHGVPVLLPLVATPGVIEEFLWFVVS